MVDLLRVKVVAALPDYQRVYTLTLPAGANVMQAIEATGVADDFPSLLIDPTCLGIFGKRVDARTRLRAGDRVEIYRPLALDPGQARRLRVKG